MEGVDLGFIQNLRRYSAEKVELEMRKKIFVNSKPYGNKLTFSSCHSIQQLSQIILQCFVFVLNWVLFFRLCTVNCKLLLLCVEMFWIQICWAGNSLI